MERRDRAVVALGGNALLRRGETPKAENQARAAKEAARLLARVTSSHQLIVTHGNGPQVGLLALMAEAYTGAPPYPLDVLDSETEGQIGYVLELELSNAMPSQQAVAVLTRVVVDQNDPAFSDPSKFIGPVYSEPIAMAAAERHGWTVKADGDHWRRVVPSPEPQRIVQLAAIECLADAGFLVVCAGGGGIPVIEDQQGQHRGVEAVIDKDLTSAKLAIDSHAATLVLVTDVDAVYENFGTPTQCAITSSTPENLRLSQFAAGSMGPKVEAICRFVEQTGGRGVIGSLHQIDDLLNGSAGTQVHLDAAATKHIQRKVNHVRAA